MFSAEGRTPGCRLLAVCAGLQLALLLLTIVECGGRPAADFPRGPDSWLRAAVESAVAGNASAAGAIEAAASGAGRSRAARDRDPRAV